MSHDNISQVNLSSTSNCLQKSATSIMVNSVQGIEKRRNKKKEMERCRRKKISNNLTKLYELTLDIIGIDNPKESTSVRIEKTEILQFCYDVLSRLSGALEERPNIRKRLRMSFKGMKMNKISPHDDLGPSFDSVFHDGPPRFNEGFTSSSSSFVNHKSNIYTKPKVRQEIWRPYI